MTSDQSSLNVVLLRLKLKRSTMEHTTCKNTRIGGCVLHRILGCNQVEQIKIQKQREQEEVSAMQDTATLTVLEGLRYSRVRGVSKTKVQTLNLNFLL